VSAVGQERTRSPLRQIPFRLHGLVLASAAGTIISPIVRYMGHEGEMKNVTCIEDLRSLPGAGATRFLSTPRLARIEETLAWMIKN